jgi:hypothetical protein
MKNFFLFTLILFITVVLISCASGSRHQDNSSKLSIGMGEKEVTHLIGFPTDRSYYTTGKQYIPFYMGRDTMRVIWLYKGEGQLIFVHGGTRFGGSMDYKLDQIVYDPSETGYKK